MAELPHEIKCLDFEDIEGERVFFWWTLYIMITIICMMINHDTYDDSHHTYDDNYHMYDDKP